jgi:flagellin
MVTSVNSAALAALLAQEQALANRVAPGDRPSATSTPDSAADPAVVYGGATGPMVSGLLAATDSLNRAASTSDVGISAGKAIGELLAALKEKTAAAQATASPQARQALDADYQSIIGTIDQIAGSASFQGVTLLNGGSGQDLTFPADLTGETAVTLAHQDFTSAGPVLGLAGTGLAGDDEELPSVLERVNAAGAGLAGRLDQMGAQSEQIQAHLGVLAQLQSALADGAAPSESADAARLQALSVQQALAGRTVAVANQAPQTVLSLFRA